ncbi:MAG: hypothetical protein JSU02_11605, partial [Bacteroidetes bacterium]|nr:hypothetical protein [Bacteroidota bacterium]
MLLVALILTGAFASGTQAQTVTIGSGTGTSSYLPLYNYYGYNYTQQIYTAAQIGQAGKIDKIRFMLNAGSLTNSTDWVVYMGNTSKASFASTTDWVPGASLTQVYSGTVPSAPPLGSWMEITLSTPFVYNGTDNLVIAVDENTPSYGSSSTNWRAFASGSNTGIYYYNDGTNPSPASPPAANNRTGTIPQVQLNFLPACTGTPVAGTIPASIALCSGSSTTITVTGATIADGLTYQWQESPDGITSWVNAAGVSINATYTTPPFSSAIYYRRIITCPASSGADTTNTAAVTPMPAPPYATFDGVSYNQGFESWSNRCYTTDVPSVNWLNTPGTGLNSWRRNDQGSSAGWLSSSGNYSPAAQAGTYSARFHSVEATLGSQGTLDLYMDMSAANGTTKLRFGYINVDGSDVLNVSVSTDGGTTFNALGAALGQSTAWADQTYNITSTSATTIIRFRATSDLGTSDIGLDNIRIFTPCVGTPAAAVASASPTSVCAGNTTVITATGTGNPASGITFQWEQSSDGLTGWVPVTGGSGANTTAYTTPALSVATYYRLNQGCSYSAQLSYSNVVPVTINVPTYATYNNTSFTEDFETWSNACNTTDAPSVSWRVSPYSGNNSWRRDDQGVSGAAWADNSGAYTPVFSTGAHSARFHSYGTTASGSLDLFIDMTAATGPTRLTFDYINTSVSGSEGLKVMVSTDGGANFTQVGNTLAVSAAWANKFFDFNSNVATTVVRLQATGGGTTDIGVDNLMLAPSPSCVAPLNVTATIASLNSANLNWVASVSNPANGYEWEARTSGAGGSGATGLQASGTVGAGITTAVATPLLQDSTYTFYVRANCGSGDYSTWSASGTLFFGYCKPAPTSVSGTGITNVAFGTLNNTTGAETGNYGNYTAISGGDVQQTLNANVAITYATGTTYGTKIWVDWNNDLDFDDAGELVYTGLSAAANPTTLNASFNVGTHALGAYRMRIGGTDTDAGPSSPCYTGTLGAFEDYTLNITAPPSCIQPTGLAVTPASTSVLIRWVASTSNPSIGYQWEVRASGAAGSGATGLESTGITALPDTSVTSGTIPSDATHYVYVRAICTAGDTSAWTGPLSFYNGYCAAAGNNTSYYINNFTTTSGFANIGNTGTGYATGGYGNYSAMAVSDTSGGSFNFSAVFGSGSNTFHFRIWVDWNNDFDFADAGEQMFDGTVYQTSYTGSITVPPGTALGSYRMRIHNTYTGTPLACGTSNGETEDYTINVVTPPSCLAPNGLTAQNVMATAADLLWNPSISLPANGYQWEVRTSGVGGSGATGLVDSGNNAAGDTTASTALLAANTQYHLYVRSDCGGLFSIWAGPFNFTTPCVSANVPYTENFDGVTVPAIPACMSIETVSGNPWTTTTATGYTGNVARVSYTSGGSPDMDSWIYTQGLNLTGGTSYRLSYKYGNNSTFYVERMSVSYGAGAAEAYMTTPLADHATINDNTPHTNTVDFTPATTGVYNIGFKCYSIADQYYLYLDDISVVPTPSCEPSLAAYVDSLANDGAGFSWAASTSNPGNGYQWEVRDGASAVVASGSTAAGDTT